MTSSLVRYWADETSPVMIAKHHPQAAQVGWIFYAVLGEKGLSNATGLNQIRCFLTNHDGGCVRISCSDRGHDGRIDDTQSLNSVYP